MSTEFVEEGINPAAKEPSRIGYRQGQFNAYAGRASYLELDELRSRIRNKSSDPSVRQRGDRPVQSRRSVEANRVPFDGNTDDCGKPQLIGTISKDTCE
jgi:hypothetical protein